MQTKYTKSFKIEAVKKYLNRSIGKTYEEKLLRHRLPSRPPSQYKPKELTASVPNEIYSWDIT